MRNRIGGSVETCWVMSVLLLADHTDHSEMESGVMDSVREGNLEGTAMMLDLVGSLVDMCCAIHEILGDLNLVTGIYRV